MKTIPAFDLEAVYDTEIYPLMEQIIAICHREKMPMLATFCFAMGRDKSDPEGVDYATTLLPRDNWQAPEIKEAAHIMLHGASTRPKMFAFTVTEPTQ